MSEPSDLRWAAGAVADTDVEQVLAFMNQHEDAEALTEHCDLCFLWTWERRQGTPMGLGAQVLQGGLQDALHRSINDQRKTPPRHQSENRHFTAARQDTPPHRRIRAAPGRRSHQAAFGNGELRLVASKPMSHDEALRALGTADLEDD